ncbi:MAG: hypothetical protein IK066_06195, partial [Kiritimatiellae bacterium]|nr:hypothetical protein [Kiritimatiellia bacterium]
TAAASAAEEGFRRAALAERCRVAGEKSAEWRFDASGAADGEALALSWQCHAGVPGNWNVRIGIAAGEGRTALLEGPAGAREETRLDWSGGGELVLAARLAEDEGADFWFDPEDGMLLRVPKGGAWGNAAKAVASWAGRLALLAAVGTTLGTLFSMPVASFLAVALLALVQCGDLLEEASGVDRDAFVRSLTAVMGGGGHSHGGEESAAPPGPWAERGAAAVYYLYKGTGWVLKPLTGDHSARQLCEGEWIPPGETARGLGWRLAALPALLGAIGTWVLRRREWGNWGGARS